MNTKKLANQNQTKITGFLEQTTILVMIFLKGNFKALPQFKNQSTQ
jgi:hypothetical protein